jgi:hypothetical protein
LKNQFTIQLINIILFIFIPATRCFSIFHGSNTVFLKKFHEGSGIRLNLFTLSILLFIITSPGYAEKDISDLDPDKDYTAISYLKSELRKATKGEISENIFGRLQSHAEQKNDLQENAPFLDNFEYLIPELVDCSLHARDSRDRCLYTIERLTIRKFKEDIPQWKQWAIKNQSAHKFISQYFWRKDFRQVLNFYQTINKVPRIYTSRLNSVLKQSMEHFEKIIRAAAVHNSEIARLVHYLTGVQEHRTYDRSLVCLENSRFLAGVMYMPGRNPYSFDIHNRRFLTLRLETHWIDQQIDMEHHWSSESPLGPRTYYERNFKNINIRVRLLLETPNYVARRILIDAAENAFRIVDQYDQYVKIHSYGPRDMYSNPLFSLARSDTMDYLISIMNVIAWPLTFIVLVMLLMGKLPFLLRFAGFKGGKTPSQDIKKQLDLIEEKILQDASSFSKKSTEKNSIWFDQMIQIAQMNPAAAIFDAWSSFEFHCMKMIAYDAKVSYPSQLKQVLLQKGITEALISYITDLRQIRNHLAYTRDDVTFLEAKKYLLIVQKIFDAIED